MFKKLTPLLTVETVEPCLSFWTERLGFTVTMSVPESGPLAFAALERDGIELMYQTRQSLKDDLGETVPSGGAMLYLEVDVIDPIAAAVPADAIAVPLRTTWYGAREIFVREPGGNVIGFAQQQAEG